MNRPMDSLSRDLSDWEVLEARQSYGRGTTLKVLAGRYKVSERTLSRAFKRMDERREG